MDELHRITERIVSAQRVTALTGAGVSAESGLSTFRDPGGLWDRFDGEEIATAEGWLNFLVTKPSRGIEFLTELRDTFAAARPNPGHEGLAELERMGIVRCVITQNVDGLHQQAGSENVLELHGTFARRRCVGCGERVALSREELVADFDRMIEKLGSYMVTHPAHLLRRCGCGGLYRADVVAFGEPVQALAQALREARTSDVMLVCGTSGVVYPAAGLPEEASGHGAFIVEVNPEPTELSPLADVRIAERAGVAVPEIVRAVREHASSRTGRTR